MHNLSYQGNKVFLVSFSFCFVVVAVCALLKLPVRLESGCVDNISVVKLHGRGQHCPARQVEVCRASQLVASTEAAVVAVQRVRS